MSSERAYELARQNIESGTSIPTAGFTKPGDTFYKLVPSGQTPLRSSYYLDTQQYLSFKSGNYSAFNNLALPDKSFATSYDVLQYVVRENRAPLKFTNEIAPAMSSAKGIRSGGLEQTIIPNSTALEMKGVVEKIGK